MLTYGYALPKDDLEGMAIRSTGISKGKTLERTALQATKGNKAMLFQTVPEAGHEGSNTQVCNAFALFFISYYGSKIGKLFTGQEVLNDYMVTQKSFRDTISGPFTELYPTFSHYRAAEIRIIASKIVLTDTFREKATFNNEEELLEYMRDQLGLSWLVERIKAPKV